MQVVEDEEDRRQHHLNDGHKEEVGDDLGEIKLGLRSRSHALGVHHLVADLAGPGLVERADRGEHGGHAQNAAGDLLAELAARVEGQREQNHNQPGEEQHGDDGVE